MLYLIAPILSYDIWFYISHVLLHAYAYEYHAKHHSPDADTLIWSDTYKAHIVEDIFQGVGLFFPYAFYQYTVLDTLIILAFLNARGMLRHDHRATWLIGNHHILHHKYYNCNFGEAWIDCACGTLYVEDQG
jgi:sterol desaturase/sphingolipid hydroxylase (fatty acid hydroxylase superfamily)